MQPCRVIISTYATFQSSGDFHLSSYKVNNIGGDQNAMFLKVLTIATLCIFKIVAFIAVSYKSVVLSKAFCGFKTLLISVHFLVLLRFCCGTVLHCNKQVST
jgi:hypothetical protein